MNTQNKNTQKPADYPYDHGWDIRVAHRYTSNQWIDHIIDQIHARIQGCIAHGTIIPSISWVAGTDDWDQPGIDGAPSNLPTPDLIRYIITADTQLCGIGSAVIAVSIHNDGMRVSVIDQYAHVRTYLHPAPKYNREGSESAYDVYIPDASRCISDAIGAARDMGRGIHSIITAYQQYPDAPSYQYRYILPWAPQDVYLHAGRDKDYTTGRMGDAYARIGAVYQRMHDIDSSASLIMLNIGRASMITSWIATDPISGSITIYRGV